MFFLSVLLFLTGISDHSLHAQDVSDKKETIIQDQYGGSGEMIEGMAPASGKAKVLAIRVGFSDMPLSDDPSDENITTDEIRCFFEGNNISDFPYESISEYYKRSSYGQLELSLGEITDVELPQKRSEYSGKSGGEAEYKLIDEIISQPGIEAKFSEYDYNGDGAPDYVYFFCNGKKDEKKSVWWPHHHNEINDHFKNRGSVLRDYILTCKENINVMIHETGHFFDIPDYYDYQDHYKFDFSVSDMMNDNHGDHNGLSKWLAGWINENDIVFADRESVGENGLTIALDPLDSPEKKGKKIAVIAPETDGIYDEYYIVEYISGTGNMTMFDGRRNYPVAFRIIHVYYNTDDGRFYADAVTKDNATGADFGVFGGNDSLTPFTIPSTDFLSEGELNVFTGISMTDFVTGDDPHFHVSFVEDEKTDNNVIFEYSSGNLSNMLELTINSDRPLDLIKNDHVGKNVRLERDGVIYPLVIKEDEYNATKFYLEYRELRTPLLPDSEYTLVIPKGTFTTETGGVVNEIKLNIKTGKFTKLENIESADVLNDTLIRSDLINFDGASVYAGLTGNNSKKGTGFRFVSYDNGKVKKEDEFFIDLPVNNKEIRNINILKTDEDNILLIIYTDKDTYLQKISYYGETLSDLFYVPELVDVIKTGGGFKGLSTGVSTYVSEGELISEGEFSGSIWTFDLKNDPKRKTYKYDAYISGGFIGLDDGYYAISGYDKNAFAYYIDIYDNNDIFINRISLSENLPLSFCADSGKITVAEISFDKETGQEYFLINVYDYFSDTVYKKRIDGENLDEIYLSGVKLFRSKYGYVLFYRYSGKTNNSLSKLMILSENFELSGSLTLPGGADCIPDSDRVVVLWEDPEGRSMAWTEVLLSQDEKDEKKQEKQLSEDETPITKKASENDIRKSATSVTNKESDTYLTEKHNVSIVTAEDTGVRDDSAFWIITAVLSSAAIAILLSLFVRKKHIKD